jgi:hypothetical protein
MALNTAANARTATRCRGPSLIPEIAAHHHPARQQAFFGLFDLKLSLPELSDARSFYIRFAKITLPETLWLFPGLPQEV